MLPALNYRFGILRIYRSGVSNNVGSMYASLTKASFTLHAKTSMNKVVLKIKNLTIRNNIYPYNICIRSVASIPNDVNNVKNDSKGDKPLTTGEKIKKMWKNYGTVAISTYIGIYVTTLTSIFYCLDYDIFNAATFGMDPIAAVEKVTYLFEEITGSKSLPAYIRENPRVGTFAIAWVMCKVTEPIRAAATIAIVPSVARALGRGPPIEDKN